MNLPLFDDAVIIVGGGKTPPPVGVRAKLLLLDPRPLALESSDARDAAGVMTSFSASLITRMGSDRAKISAERGSNSCPRTYFGPTASIQFFKPVMAFEWPANFGGASAASMRRRMAAWT